MTREILLSLAMVSIVVANGPASAQSILSPAPPSFSQGPALPGPLAEDDEFDRLDDERRPIDAQPRTDVRAGTGMQGPVLSPDDPRYGAPNPHPPGAQAGGQVGGSGQVGVSGQAGAAQGQPPGHGYAPGQGYAPGHGVSGQATAAPPPGGGFIYPEANRQAPGDDPRAASAVNRPPGEVGGGPANAALPDGQPSPTTGRSVAMLPPEDQPETGKPKELPAYLKRQEVDFATKEAPGTIVIDTANTHLYYVLGNGRAIRYGIRVGRDGFRWTGMEKVTRKVEWPDWHPPTEMIERQPYLPRFMAGGPGNPLGARAMYLGNTVYRIHGTNQPSTIGRTVSSGCFGLLNEDVEDLYERVKIGSKVVVLEGEKKSFASGPPVSLAAPNPVGPAPGNGNGVTSAPLPPPAAAAVPPPAGATVRQ